jgi:muconolactone D-isomerase
MEFLVEFELSVPAGTPQAEVQARQRGEAEATAQFAEEGHLARVWSATSKVGGPVAIGLYSAGSPSELEDVLRRLPLYDWMCIEVTPLQAHPNDPLIAGTTT